jgi:multidrug efflux system membrane fusion protein
VRVTLAMSVALVACRSSGEQKRATPAVPVRVAPVTRIDAPIVIAASGVVEPMQTVSVEAQATGTVFQVAFRQGDWVAAGQVLFRLDPRPLQDARDQARAILARDEAQATAARHDAERYGALAAKGYVTESQAEQMHATALAQAATVVADRAVLRTAERNLGFATIRAPIAGRTGSVQLRRGDLVGPQTGPLVVINQLRPILVRFPVLAGDFGVLRAAVAAHPLPVTATSSDSGNFQEVGTLNFLDNAIDSLTGTVTGRAVFGNAGSRMWPGELVFLSVQAGTQRGVLVVPTPAIQTGQQGAFVYVVDLQRKTAQTRAVAAGRAVGELTIVAAGLKPGEQVVTDGQSRLSQGSRVAIIAPNGAGARGRVAGGVGTSGVVGGEVVTGTGVGTVGGSGASGVTTGAPSTEGGSGVAASSGQASPYSGSPSTSGQAPGTAASQTVAPGATQAPVGTAVIPQPTGAAPGARTGNAGITGAGTAAGTGAGTAGATGRAGAAGAATPATGGARP